MNYRFVLFLFSFFAASFCGNSAFAADGNAFEEKARKFLCEYMPEQDRGKLSEDYLQENVRLALAVREHAPWSRGIPEEIFLNDVLPYSSIGEEVDAWRPVFYKTFSPLVADCKNATQVAEKLNREIWEILGVIYSPKRDKPDQSPFHSMRIGMASCSGLSVILVDACRAVGVPARLAGCRWKKKPGNHSWVEIWDRGKWYHIGAFDSPKAGESWFDGDAAAANADDPVYAIYATSWAPTGTYFNAVWRRPSDLRSKIPAYNVTARYLGKSAESGLAIPLGILLCDASGKRVAVPVKVVEKKSRRVLAEGVSHDDTQDLNNHFTISAPAGTVVEIYARTQKSAPEVLLDEYVFGTDSKTLRLILPQVR